MHMHGVRIVLTVCCTHRNAGTSSSVNSHTRRQKTAFTILLYGWEKVLSKHGRTRAEFEGWARPLAAAHGYEVHFEGVGRLRPEILKAMPPAFADVVAAEPGLGCATQVAMFVQRKA
jgi:hypothetical protein